MHKGENALVKWKVCRINLLLTSWDKRPNGSSTEVISSIMAELERAKNFHLKTHKKCWLACDFFPPHILIFAAMCISYLLSKLRNKQFGGCPNVKKKNVCFKGIEPLPDESNPYLQSSPGYTWDTRPSRWSVLIFSAGVY